MVYGWLGSISRLLLVGLTMTVLILVAGLALGMFEYEPSWFDTRPHYYHMTYNSKAQCQEARELVRGKGTVCTDKHDLYKTK